MPQKFNPIDIRGVKTYNLSDRKSKVTAEDFAKTWQKGASYRAFLDYLPDILAGGQLKSVISAILKAYRGKRTILFGMGAHVVKVGLNPVVIDLMERGIITGVAMFCLGFLLLPLAEYVPETWQSGWLLGTRLLTSFGGPLFWVNGNLYLMDKTNVSSRNHAFSLRTAFFPLAGFVGSLLGGTMPQQFANLLNVTLTNPAPYRFSLLLGAAMLLPAIPIILRTSKVEGQISRNNKKEESGLLPYHLFIPMAMIMLLRTVGESAARGFYNVYLDTSLGVSTAQIGTIAAIGLLVSVPAALITASLATRWGKERIYLVSMLGMGLCLLPLALIHHWLAAAVGYVGLMMFAAATKPTLYVYRLEIISVVWWAAMSGTGGTFHGIGEVMTSFGGGFIITGFGFRAFFLSASILTLLGAAFFWLFSRAVNKKNPTYVESTPSYRRNPG